MLSRRGFMQTGLASVALVATPGVVHALYKDVPPSVAPGTLPFTNKQVAERGYFMLMGFGSFAMDHESMFRDFGRKESQDIVRKYGHHDPVHDIWWTKMGLKQEPEQPTEVKAILTLAGDLTPAFHAQHILMCQGVEVLAELKNRTGVTLNIPPQMFDTSTKILLQERGSRGDNNMVRNEILVL